MADAGGMRAAEINNLMIIVRKRERVARATIRARAAQLLADLERQIDTYYSPLDDSVWKQAHDEALAAMEVAKAAIERRNRELGIPRRFRPTIRFSWDDGNRYSRESDKNALRRTVGIRIDAMTETALAEVERTSLDAQTQIASRALTSDEAKALLAAMPQPEQLLPEVALDDVRQLLAEEGTQIGQIESDDTE